MHTLPIWCPSWLTAFIKHHGCVRSGLLDCDDATNEILLKLWQRQQAGKTLITRRLVGWMVASLARKAYPRKTRHLELTEEVVAVCGIEQRMYAKDLLHRLDRILEDFAPSVQALFRLVASGCTVRDASLQLGLAPTTGHRWFHRVREQLNPANDGLLIFFG